MSDQSDTPTEQSGESETPVHLPPIDFSKPTQDPMTEVRKGVGGERRENK